jgi:[ribosomal protein S5]-alanine N-acetyltransferase
MEFPTQFTTARLTLRKPELADAPAIFTAYAQDPEVTRFLVWRPHPNLATTHAYIEHCVSTWNANTEYCYVLTEHARATLVGMISVRVRDWSASLGYVLARSAWGQGIMPEAAQAVSDYVLEQPAMYRVWAVCDVDNTASARVMEKIGMMREGLMHRGVLHPNISSEPRDCWLYAKVK